ncbi:putative quinol monooxygenase [Streptomyces spirodelae]|uniref:Antibiotic biosynthesis monooxygenase n=1 Tax=Streptomyces spirodelae TaxID=2812904 RepID=A0ABS3X3Q4_9ACTN|nr:putative quinol monooxygenase [Streptomyces spirodelae]MBO8189946.1 antibiotic biosynthesis monooxygenase [Streptomyces spirodelae]
MIFTAVRFAVRPEYADEWLSLVGPFTEATRAEPGNLFFDWSRDADDPNRFTLLEAFADDAAGAAHVESEHFKAGLETMSTAIAETPRIINVNIPDQHGWGTMAELTPKP